MQIDVKALPEAVAAILTQKIDSSLRGRAEVVEERLQQKAHEFSMRGMLQSGGAYVQMREVLDEEIRERATSLWDVILSVVDDTGIALPDALSLELKAVIRAAVREAVDDLSPRLEYIVKATGFSRVEPLAPLGEQVLADVEADIDLAVLRQARTRGPEVNDCFARFRDRLETACNVLFSEALPKLLAIQANLQSTNPEDWANAVHSCRRLLQELADTVFPPQTDTRTAPAERGGRQIKLGPENYINRLVAFVEDSSASERFTQIVGSDLKFLGDRLDAVFGATQKGSHAAIGTRAEADRYVVRALLIVADVLLLHQEKRLTAET